MTGLLPAPESSTPEGKDGHAPGSQRDHRPRRRTRDPLPSVEQLLDMLLKLNGAVLVGAVSPAKAAVIHRNLRAVLDTQLKRDKSGKHDACPADLAEACRRQPELLNTLEPFLSDEQLEWLMGQASGGGDGPA